MEYDSNNFAGICSSVTVLRQSLIAARTSSIISDAFWRSIMLLSLAESKALMSDSSVLH